MFTLKFPSKKDGFKDKDTFERLYLSRIKTPSCTVLPIDKRVGIPKIAPLVLKFVIFWEAVLKISSCQSVFAFPKRPTSPGLCWVTMFLNSSAVKTSTLFLFSAVLYYKSK